MDVHLRDLRYFVAVAEELNFTAAAERLHLSQPALSKQIRALESATRARLFERDHRRVALTPAGEALLPVARHVLEAWDQGARVVAAVDANARRMLRVGTLTSIGRALYPAIIDRFSVRQPGWHIRLRSYDWNDPTAGLNDGGTDVAFLWLPVDGDLSWQVLVSERRFVAMSASHPLAGRSAVTFADIADQSFIALPGSAGSTRAFWLAEDARSDKPAHVAAEVGSADETFEVVSSGQAVALLAEGNALVYARPGIVCIPVTDLQPAQLAVGWRTEDDRLSVQAFIRSCVDAAAEVDAQRLPG